jgi:KaiC/GvpD/RAD55 family RecA-like ATPase
MSGPPLSDTLRIVDSVSFLARFNDEKSWVEFLLTRAFPTDTRRKLTTLRGMTTGVHSEWAYRQLEAAADGIVDFKLSEAGEQPTTLVRIRSMRSVGFDGRWRQLKVEDNMRATLET